ncbi:MAG TPA: sigma-70 family RNA polymerase sigma factor [Pyrinomonadaceae bacterium]|nr:sigma-70 family RNA polymerase sigma factor [Pyrinomonadaceae bacterium]
MNDRPAHDVTLLLSRVSEGDNSAPGKLLELVYDDLRHLAAAYMQDERSDHTLQATALVHEAYLRMVDWENVSWENRAQFFAVAAQVMRRVLVDHARSRNAAKRGGSQQKLALDDAVSFANEKEFDVLALEDALVSLAKQDPRQAKIVELRFFGGMTIDEAAHVLKISSTTVKDDWTMAKAWFQRELSRNQP